MCVCILSSPDILLLGVLGDGDTLAVGFELMLDDFSVSVVLHAESVVQDASDVIVPEEEGGQVKDFKKGISEKVRLFTPFFLQFF